MRHPQKTAEIAELRQALHRLGEIAMDECLNRAGDVDALDAALDELERLRKEIPRLHAAGSRLANAVQYRRHQVMRLQVDGEMVRIPRKYIDEALAGCPFEAKT